MKFLEKDLEDIIFNADGIALADRGLYGLGKMSRQVRIGNYGIADIVSFSRPYRHPYFEKMMKGTICVLELKQEKITASAFLQAVRYVKGIQRYLYKHKPNLWDKFNYEIILIGRSFCSDSDIAFLPDLFNLDTCEKQFDSEECTSVSMYTYNYDIDGITFNRIEDYRRNNEGF